MTLTSSLVIEPLAGNIGAEIGGVDIAGQVTESTVGEIRRALLRYKVIFIREQGIDYDSQVRFARQFGELAVGHPIFTAPTERPELRALDSDDGIRANHWHTDLTFLERPPAFAFLYGKVIPPVGGDTMWANAATAYTSLSTEMRELADRLRIVHSNDSDYTEETVDARREYIAKLFEADHPAVRVHPETGEPSLLLGGFAKRVVGLGPQPSRDLLRIMQESATRPEHTVRWRWRTGDLAIWDNQATLHYAVRDYGTARRRVERVTVAGDVPVGVDGRPGRVLAG
jgi:alpha-ketoglutarate-dependent sulfate ester dioxygenase